MEEFDNFVKRNTVFLDNQYVSGALTVFLIIYAGAIAPKLPNKIVKLFDNVYAQLLVFFLIVFLSRKNATVAIIAAIAMMVSIMALNRVKFDEEMMEVVSGEEKASKRVRLNSCECTCDNIEEIKPITPDGKLISNEIKTAVNVGALSEEGAKQLIKNIVISEIKGEPVLVAKTDIGAKRMEEIENLVKSGDMDAEEGKQKVAFIVVSEVVMEERKIDPSSETVLELPQNLSPTKVSTPSVESVASTLSTDNKSQHSSLAEMAEEVLKRKNEEMSKNGGIEPTDDQMRELCANVVDDYRRCSLGCDKNKSCQISKLMPSSPNTYGMFAGVSELDSFDSQYATFNN